MCSHCANSIILASCVNMPADCPFIPFLVIHSNSTRASIQTYSVVHPLASDSSSGGRQLRKMRSTMAVREADVIDGRSELTRESRWPLTLSTRRADARIEESLRLGRMADPAVLVGSLLGTGRRETTLALRPMATSRPMSAVNSVRESCARTVWLRFCRLSALALTLLCPPALRAPDEPAVVESTRVDGWIRENDNVEGREGRGQTGRLKVRATCISRRRRSRQRTVILRGMRQHCAAQGVATATGSCWHFRRCHGARTCSRRARTTWGRWPE